MPFTPEVLLGASLGQEHKADFRGLRGGMGLWRSLVTHSPTHSFIQSVNECVHSRGLIIATNYSRCFGRKHGQLRNGARKQNNNKNSASCCVHLIRALPFSYCVVGPSANGSVSLGVCFPATNSGSCWTHKVNYCISKTPAEPEGRQW